MLSHSEPAPASASRRSWLKQLTGLLAGGALFGKSTAAAAPRPAASPQGISDNFLGEIMMCAFDFPPKGWALCNGQLLPINVNQALFSLLGTTYGGNGQTTFALPDLRGRIPMGAGYPHLLGESGGVDQVTLTTAQMPPHLHGFPVSRDLGTTSQPGSFSAANYLADNGGGNPQYGPAINGTLATSAPSPPAALPLNTSTATGSSQPHDNRQPSLCVSFCIALQGVFPSQN